MPAARTPLLRHLHGHFERRVVGGKIGEVLIRQGLHDDPHHLVLALADVEAAANLLANPKLDPFGKIPEFKFCAAKVERAEPVREAAE